MGVIYVRVVDTPTQPLYYLGSRYELARITLIKIAPGCRHTNPARITLIKIAPGCQHTNPARITLIKIAPGCRHTNPATLLPWFKV
jgi:hypothetical protein